MSLSTIIKAAALPPRPLRAARFARRPRRRPSGCPRLSVHQRQNYPARVDLIGYLAGGLCVACLVALAALGGRAIRLAVAAFVLVVLASYALFVAWLSYGLFAVWPTL
jgi:hypothetical protein